MKGIDNMKKTRTAGRFLGVILSAAMSFSSLPLMSITAEAAANTDWNFTDYDDKYKSRKGTGYEWIVNSSGTHSLSISNVDIVGTLKVPEDTTIKFSGKNTIKSSDGEGISGSGALTILGADSKSTLSIRCTDDYSYGIVTYDALKVSGKLNISSVHNAIKGNTVTVKNADITAETSRSNAHALSSSKDMTIQSSEIRSEMGGINCGSSLKITSSIISVNDTNGYSGVNAEKLTVSGSKLDIKATDYYAINVSTGTKLSNSDIKARTDYYSAVNVKNFEMSSGTLDAATTKSGSSAIRYNTNTKFALNNGLSVKGSSSASGSADTKIYYEDGYFIYSKQGYKKTYAQRVVITDGKKITVDTADSSSSTRTLKVDFGKEFAGRTVVLYKIEAGNEVKVKSAKLDSKGRAEFNILNGVSYVVKLA